MALEIAIAWLRPRNGDRASNEIAARYLIGAWTNAGMIEIALAAELVAPKLS
jgi:hypothetical protein